MLDESTAVAPRDHRYIALARLDTEFARYEAERRRPEVYAKRESTPLGSVEEEARTFVADRFVSPHANLERRIGEHHGISCGDDDCDHPTCQREVCDSCHRVLALMYASAFCQDRKEYQPILDWIMNPEFLA